MRLPHDRGREARRPGAHRAAAARRGRASCAATRLPRSTSTGSRRRGAGAAPAPTRQLAERHGASQPPSEDGPDRHDGAGHRAAGLTLAEPRLPSSVAGRLRGLRQHVTRHAVDDARPRRASLAEPEPDRPARRVGAHRPSDAGERLQHRVGGLRRAGSRDGRPARRGSAAAPGRAARSGARGCGAPRRGPAPGRPGRRPAGRRAAARPAGPVRQPRDEVPAQPLVGRPGDRPVPHPVRQVEGVELRAVTAWRPRRRPTGRCCPRPGRGPGRRAGR